MQITMNQRAMPPALPWIAPFIAFMAMLALTPSLGLSPKADLALRLLVPASVFIAFSTGAVSWKPRLPLASFLAGVAVFVLWVAPDLLIRGWREHWLFQNVVTGKLESTIPPNALTDSLVIALRILRAIVIVPLAEELFWRGWLMRWLIHHDFQSVPLGAYTRQSFWLTTVLFAAVHGPYWDVGLIAGAVYNMWMVRTKSVADLVLAHAVTNACLAVFVLMTNRWEYWL